MAKIRLKVQEIRSTLAGIPWKLADLASHTGEKTIGKQIKPGLSEAAIKKAFTEGEASLRTTLLIAKALNRPPQEITMAEDWHLLPSIVGNQTNATGRSSVPVADAGEPTSSGANEEEESEEGSLSFPSNATENDRHLDRDDSAGKQAAKGEVSGTDFPAVSQKVGSPGIEETTVPASRTVRAHAFVVSWPAMRTPGSWVKNLSLIGLGIVIGLGASTIMWVSKPNTRDNHVQNMAGTRTLIFDNDFKQNNSRYVDNQKTDRFEISVTRGAFFIRINKGNHLKGMSETFGTEATNFICEAKLKAKNASLFMTFRETIDPPSKSNLNIHILPSGKWKMEREYGSLGGGREAALLKAGAVNWPTPEKDEWQHFRVVADDRTVRWELNGKLVTEISDTFNPSDKSHPSNWALRIGIYADTNEMETFLEIDDLRIWRLN